MASTMVVAFVFVVFIVAHTNTLLLNPGISLLNREKVAVKKGLALAFLNKIKDNPMTSNEGETNRQNSIAHFHPMVRLRADTLNQPPHEIGNRESPYWALSKHVPRDVREDQDASMDDIRMEDQDNDFIFNR